MEKNENRLATLSEYFDCYENNPERESLRRKEFTRTLVSNPYLLQIASGEESMTDKVKEMMGFYNTFSRKLFPKRKVILEEELKKMADANLTFSAIKEICSLEGLNWEGEFSLDGRIQTVRWNNLFGLVIDVIGIGAYSLAISKISPLSEAYKSSPGFFIFGGALLAPIIFYIGKNIFTKPLRREMSEYLASRAEKAQDFLRINYEKYYVLQHEQSVDAIRAI
jgi:hypothetical protein